MRLDDFKKRLRDTFHTHARNADYGPLQGDVNHTQQQRALEKRVTEVRATARAHFAKNYQSWVDKEINRLSAERHQPSGHAPPPPRWPQRFVLRSTHPKAIERVAKYRVETRFQHRIGRIQTIYEKERVRIMTQSKHKHPHKLALEKGRAARDFGRSR